MSRNQSKMNKEKQIFENQISLILREDKTLEIYVGDSLAAEISDGRLDMEFAKEILEGLDYEINESSFTIRPLHTDEQKYTYKQSTQIEGQTGNIGYLRGDFGPVQKRAGRGYQRPSFRRIWAVKEPHGYGAVCREISRQRLSGQLCDRVRFPYRHRKIQLPDTVQSCPWGLQFLLLLLCAGMARPPYGKGEPWNPLYYAGLQRKIQNPRWR